MLAGSCAQVRGGRPGMAGLSPLPAAALCQPVGIQGQENHQCAALDARADIGDTAEVTGASAWEERRTGRDFFSESLATHVVSVNVSREGQTQAQAQSSVENGELTGAGTQSDSHTRSVPILAHQHCVESDATSPWRCVCPCYSNCILCLSHVSPDAVERYF